MDNMFYKCYDCNKNLCPLCKSNHEKKDGKVHIIKNYDLKDFFVMIMVKDLYYIVKIVIKIYAKIATIISINYFIITVPFIIN